MCNLFKSIVICVSTEIQRNMSLIFQSPHWNVREAEKGEKNGPSQVL